MNGNQFEVHWLPPLNTVVTGYEINIAPVGHDEGLFHIGGLPGSTRSWRGTLTRAVSPSEHITVFVDPFSASPPTLYGSAEAQFVTPVTQAPTVRFTYCGDAARMWADAGNVPGATSYTAVFQQTVTGVSVERTIPATIGGLNRILDDQSPMPTDAPNWSVTVTANPSNGSASTTVAAPTGTTCVV